MKIPNFSLEFGDAALLRDAAEFYVTHAPKKSEGLTPTTEARLLLASAALYNMALEYDELEVRGVNEPKDEPTPACAE